MNRTVLAAGLVFLVVTIVGFVVNAPLLAWVCLAITAILLVSSFVVANPTSAVAISSQRTHPEAGADLIGSEIGMGVGVRPLETPSPSNPGMPVNAGPPHISESREDPFDTNGATGGH